MIEIVIAGIAGLALGHVLDLAFDHFYTDEKPFGPIYRCSYCRSKLRPIFAVPLVGVLVHRGNCPDCDETLPMRAVVLPAGSVALFAISYLVFDELGAALLSGSFATVFLLLTLTDVHRHLLPNRIIYPSILLAIALSWGWPDTSVSDVLLGGGTGIAVAAGLLLFSLPFGSGAFGMGDVKMIVLIGFVVGFPAVIAAVIIGTLAAGLGAALLLVTRVKGLRDYIPHGPFLAFGAIFALFAHA